MSTEQRRRARRTATLLMVSLIGGLIADAPALAVPERQGTPPPKTRGATGLAGLVAGGATATALTSAMSLQPGLVTAASFDVLAGGGAAGVGDGFTGKYMPTQGAPSRP